MNKEQIEGQLKLSKRQNKYERYDYLCSEFNGINYCIKLEKYTNKLQQENQELKKQLEEIKSTNNVLSEELTKDKILKQDCLTTCCGIPIGDIPKLLNQQKEFIEYLENEIDICNDWDRYKILVVNEILSKYKEIIGVSDENNT